MEHVRGRSVRYSQFRTPHIWETIRAKKLKFYTQLDGPSTLFGYKNFSVRGVRRVQRPLVYISAFSVNLEPPHICETIRARKLKFYTHLDGLSTFFGYEHFSVRGVRRVQRPLVYISAFSVNLEPPHICGTIRARKLKFYTRLDSIKCTFWKWQFCARGVSGCSAPSVKLGPPQNFFR